MTEILFKTLYFLAPLYAKVLLWLGSRIPWARGLGLRDAPPADINISSQGYALGALTSCLRSRQLRNLGFRVRNTELENFIDQYVSGDMDNFRKFADTNGGVIYACPHYGPFLLSALLFAALGTPDRPSNVFYDPPNLAPQNERFDEVFSRFKTRLKVLHNTGRDLIEALRALRRREALAIMFDIVQSPDESMLVPFCGRLYPAMGGAAYLALQSGAPIVPVYVVPDRAARIRVVLGNPILPEDYKTGDRADDIFNMTCALFSGFERQLMNEPWHWVYWKNVQGAASFDLETLKDARVLADHIRLRCSSMPELLKLAPTLQAFAA